MLDKHLDFGLEGREELLDVLMLEIGACQLVDLIGQLLDGVVHRDFSLLRSVQALKHTFLVLPKTLTLFYQRLVGFITLLEMLLKNKVLLFENITFLSYL